MRQQILAFILQMTNSLTGTGAGNGCLFGLDATLLKFAINNTSNADIYFKTNGNERFRIKIMVMLVLRIMHLLECYALVIHH